MRKPYLRLVGADGLEPGSEAEVTTNISSCAGFTPCGTVAKVLAVRGDWISVSVYVSPLSGGRGSKRIVVLSRSELWSVERARRVA